jgi:two-component system cell cycle response regulator DivK
MANETILIVDDAAVDLKLTDILLRKQGYKIHVTTDGEQALGLLRSIHPDLMLVDIRLPGMDGLELTRRVKLDPSMRDIVVVALTASAGEDDKDRALQAGCDGYMTKPIETLTLARRVRGFLEQRSAPAPPDAAPAAEEPGAFPGGITLSPSELESVRRRFLEEAVLRCQHLLEGLDLKFDIPRSMRISRDWKEAARVLDYPVLSLLAGEVEKVLESRPLDLELLRDALSNLLVGFLEPPEANMGAVPPAVEAALTRKSVALIGCTDETAEVLCGALERAGAKPRLFEADRESDAEAIGLCGLVVVHVRPGTLGKHWLHPLTLAELTRPLVLIGAYDNLMDVNPGVLVQASDLLIDGWLAEEALIRLSHAVDRAASAKTQTPAPEKAANRGTGLPMPREIAREAEVLLADDDLTVRTLVRSIILGAGVKCRLACDGHEALQLIRDQCPTVAVLDINMPGMDGYEVLAAIRKEALPVRVILLTARENEADVTRGFNLGADDYIVKPFSPAELLSRLRRYLN